jgi:HD-like signal output (HDOD) protein
MLHEDRVPDDFVVHELRAGGGGEPVSDQQLWETLTRTFQSPGFQPPMLPQVAADLLALPCPADADPFALARLLERDPRLARRVLELCCAPPYGDGVPASSLESAAVRLGSRRLRDVVMEAALSGGVFKTGGYSEAVDRVRVHSTAVAHVARTIARFVMLEEDCAFLCGLLHDVGLSVALVALGDVPRGQKLRPVVDLWPALAALHETVSGSVATLWQLPAEVCMVLRRHHSTRDGDFVHPLAAIVLLAESIAGERGRGLVPPSLKVRGAAQPSLLFGPHRIDVPSAQQVSAAKAALGFDGWLYERVAAACARVLEAL